MCKLYKYFPFSPFVYIDLFFGCGKITDLTKMSCKYRNYDLWGSWNKMKCFSFVLLNIFFSFFKMCLLRTQCFGLCLDINLIFLSHSLKWIKNIVMNQKWHKTKTPPRLLSQQWIFLEHGKNLLDREWLTVSLTGCYSEHLS